jgi:hypothetical protein
VHTAPNSLRAPLPPPRSLRLPLGSASSALRPASLSRPLPLRPPLAVPASPRPDSAAARRASPTLHPPGPRLLQHAQQARSRSRSSATARSRSNSKPQNFPLRRALVPLSAVGAFRASWPRRHALGSARNLRPVGGRAPNRVRYRSEEEPADGPSTPSVGDPRTLAATLADNAGRHTRAATLRDRQRARPPRPRPAAPSSHAGRCRSAVSPSSRRLRVARHGWPGRESCRRPASSVIRSAPRRPSPALGRPAAVLAEPRPDRSQSLARRTPPPGKNQQPTANSQQPPPRHVAKRPLDPPSVTSSPAAAAAVDPVEPAILPAQNRDEGGRGEQSEAKHSVFREAAFERLAARRHRGARRSPPAPAPPA